MIALRLLRNEVRRILIEYIRYPFETISGLIIVVIIFYGLFLGATYLSGSASSFGDRLESIVLGYVMWTLLNGAVLALAQDIQRNAQTGVLEQLYLTPYGTTLTFSLRMVARLGYIVGFSLAVFVIVAFLTGARFTLSWVALLPLIPILIAGYGMSFIAGAFALILKQVNIFLSLLQFALLFLVMIPVETWRGPFALAGYALPIVPGIGIMRDVMARGLAFDTTEYMAILLISCAYFFLGVTIFRRANAFAKRRGIIGDY